jgi:hypothetical protein
MRDEEKARIDVAKWDFYQERVLDDQGMNEAWTKEGKET